MPDEPIIAPVNADVPVIVAPPAESEPESEEIDLVAELVARSSIEREEQHDETMEAIEQCQTQLASLTASIQILSQTQTAENPMLAEMQRQLAEVRALQQNLLESMASKPWIPNEPSGSPKMESPTDAIPQVEPKVTMEEKNEPPPKRRRFRKL